MLEEVLGLNVVEYPTARMEGETLYRDPRRRAEDINRAFSDENIDAIMATIGGEDSIRILEYLDIQTILSNPKIIMGFSDTVAVLNYLNYRGLITFHGPTIMAGWAQVGNFDFLPEYYEKLLMGNQAGAEVRPFPQWSSGYPDWKEPNRLGEVLDKRENTTGFRWLQGKEKTNGFLWGGCLEVLLMLKGTRFWPEQGFWEGRILMLETSEEKPPPALMGCFLRTLGVEGILGKLGGIFLGRPRDYSSAEKETLYEIVQRVVVEEFKEKDLNIVANMDFGHTDPNLILPLGSQVEIAPEERKIRFTESFFQESTSKKRSG